MIEGPVTPSVQLPDEEKLCRSFGSMFRFPVPAPSGVTWVESSQRVLLTSTTLVHVAPLRRILTQRDVFCW